MLFIFRTIGVACCFFIAVITTSALALSANSLPASSTDIHLVWERAPIAITLPVGRERFVSFPTTVKFGYNARVLSPSVLRVENDNHTLYLLAKQPFHPQRIKAKLSNGDVILLDISATSQAPDQPIDITLPPTHLLHQSKSTKQFYKATMPMTLVTLTRYAIQQLYAPRRLLRHNIAITRFPMATTYVVPLFIDDSAVAMPLASWRGGDYYVTALLIKNKLPKRLRLNPRWLCGYWKAASFYPQIVLASHGAAINRDASTAFLVSKQPFSRAIQPCLNE